MTCAISYHSVAEHIFWNPLCDTLPCEKKVAYLALSILLGVLFLGTLHLAYLVCRCCCFATSSEPDASIVETAIDSVKEIPSEIDLDQEHAKFFTSIGYSLNPQWQGHAVANDDFIFENFLKAIKGIPPDRCHYDLILFASFNASQAHNVFEAGGVLPFIYNEVLKRPEGSTILFYCPRDEEAENELLEDSYWIPGLADVHAKLHVLTHEKQLKAVGLRMKDLPQNDGTLPWKLRQELFGTVKGAFSYIF